MLGMFRMVDDCRRMLPGHPYCPAPCQLHEHQGDGDGTEPHGWFLSLSLESKVQVGCDRCHEVM